MRAKSRITLLGLSLMFAVGAWHTPARAQATDVNREAMAEALYQDGRKLMKERHFAEACPKLAESHAIDPAGGTVLLLALCYEQIGKTASAWVKFNEARAAARRDGREDREERAEQHIAKLEPQLSRLTISVAAETATVDGLRISIDGAEVPKLAWARGLPADPGSHRIDASAPSKRPWSTVVELGANGARATVEVPMLEDLPPTESVEPAAGPTKPATAALGPQTPASDTGSSTGSSANTFAWIVGGLGVVTLAGGGYFGIRALDRDSDARDRCPNNTCTDPKGVELNEDARKDAMRANALVGAGLVLVGVGTYLWLSAPDEDGSGTALVVQPDARASGLSIGTTTRW